MSNIQAQTIPDSTCQTIGKYLTETANKQTRVGKIKIDSTSILKKKIQLFSSVNLANIGYDKQLVDDIYSKVSDLLPDKYKKHDLEIYSDGYKLENYIPFSRKERFENKPVIPLVTNKSNPFNVKKGLAGRHIAMWQSHGWYYEQKLARWEWQRARIFQTVEDLYTQSYVLPYLVPMLENAGANVLLPRERDIQRYEVIVDNDKSYGRSVYKETRSKEQWITGDKAGFAHQKEYYLDGENPFKEGKYRQVKSINKGDESLCEWIPDMPEKGNYAVYVSYATVKNSTEDARYTVYHLGGKTEFSVNQTMGGGTWIFLGFFTFDKGLNNNCKIVLTNKSSKSGRTITADAVKIGGGMGNIARLPHPEGIVTQNTKSSETADQNKVVESVPINFKPEISGYPRYTEGARYWLQWAGAPDSVYNRSESTNDYTDDYQSRGFWVNYLAGGSSVLPKSKGLNIPIDMTLAFHTDAGITFNDSIIGTLGICMTHYNNELFANGKPRILSRDLTASIMDETVNDIRIMYEPNWTRRQIWNRSYSEARVPEVPTMLLELLSHQNFADMKYGHDPRFRFMVSRSIYKGILKHIAYQYKSAYAVQPLPVQSFSAEFADETQVKLQWQPVNDPLEPTAIPDSYILYTRIGEGDFNNGILVKNNSASVTIEKDKIYSFRITAVNEGGESFPSEILSVCRKSNEKGEVLVVNGFTRLSAPFSFQSTDSIAGFVDAVDHGVPDKVQYNYIGSQFEYRRRIPWMDDDAVGFGGSNANYETTVIAGNIFDYPYVHGLAISNAGYSFVSTSVQAVMDRQIDLKYYRLVDLILGKQKQTKIGRGVHSAEFKTFPDKLQSCLTDYCLQGGNIFISGAFVATDLWDTEHIQISDHEFANNILGYKWRAGRAAVTGKVKAVASPFTEFKGNYGFYNMPNSDCYVVESPDALEAYGEGSHTIFRYSENNLSAGIASQKDYKTCILGFPFETIMDSAERNLLMKGVLDFMFKHE